MRTTDRTVPQEAIREDLIEIAHLAHLGAHAARLGTDSDLIAAITEMIARLKAAAAATCLLDEPASPRARPRRSSR